MEIGVGLPTMVAGVRRKQLLDWAVEAESHHFSTLAVLDRLVYGGDEALITLGAAAAVTDRIRLATSILIAPYRGNTALLAKQAATLHHLSGERLVLGMAVGAREDDYAASGVSFHDRGCLLDRMLDEIHLIWHDGEIGPALNGSTPEILIGGHSEAALRRVAEHGDGWIGAGAVQTFLPRARTVRAYWTGRKRAGSPRMVAQAYYSLGPTARDDAAEHLGDYYGFFGPRVGVMVDSALTTADAVRDTASAYKDAGCDELILVPCSADPRQLELLRDTLGDS
ncbi:MAG: hypothetical protein JWN54_4000 [Mycobacterium sp.]|nr:hypothetical protein [Mycobacterium sp.]